MHKTTHTYAELPVSAVVYHEIADLLRAAGYDHVFIDGAIDMHGIALVRDDSTPVIIPTQGEQTECTQCKET